MIDNSLKLFDTELRYSDRGDSATIVFLHGGGGPETCEALAESLSNQYRVVMPVHPGFTQGDMPGWMRQVADLAYYYLEMLEQLKLENVYLMGHSLGGWIAAEMAIRDQSRLCGLCLISAGGIRVPGSAIANNFLWTPEETVRNFFVSDALVDKFLAKLEQNEDPLEAVLRRQTLARLVWKPRWHSPELQKWLKRIHIPTQIIWGKQDKLFPVRNAEVFAPEIPGAQLTLIDACGHLPFVEKADECRLAINQLLHD